MMKMVFSSYVDCIIQKIASVFGQEGRYPAKVKGFLSVSEDVIISPQIVGYF